MIDAHQHFRHSARADLDRMPQIGRVLRPHSDHVPSVFGPERLMAGSDWPVLRLRCVHGDWYAQANRAVEDVTPASKTVNFGATARRFDRIV